MCVISLYTYTRVNLQHNHLFKDGKNRIEGHHFAWSNPHAWDPGTAVCPPCPCRWWSSISLDRTMGMGLLANKHLSTMTD